MVTPTADSGILDASKPSVTTLSQKLSSPGVSALQRCWAMAA